MSSKRILIPLLTAYLVVCSVLIFQSGLFSDSSGTNNTSIIALASEVPAQDTIAPATTQVMEMKPSEVDFGIANSPQKTVTIGSIIPAEQGNDFLVEAELTSRGAAVAMVRLRDYDDRDPKDPKPLELLSPIDGKIFSMASRKLNLFDFGVALPLDILNWNYIGTDTFADGSQKAVFEAVVKNGSAEAIKLTKSFTVVPNSYMLTCDIAVANLTGENLLASFDMLGPVGINREGSRSDMRTITSAFLNQQSIISPARTKIGKISKQAPIFPLVHKDGLDQFVWTSISNKYFTAIVWPVPFDENGLSSEWIFQKFGHSYLQKGVQQPEDKNIGISFATKQVKIAPESRVNYRFQLYLGPKDKKRFETNELYSRLGFINAIDFQACCGDMFRPLSFFILTAMEWMHDFFWPHNYGVVIIIFVFVVRVLLHPITKRSQVSMMKMSKLAPMAEEIKRKYANNKAEQNKQMMELYKQHGASPILGCLPMLLQLPIWIALYSAIYAGIELRGAPFLPFWITDLSVPDALFILPAAIENIPFVGGLIGTNFNLLPILLGVSMFAQQKMMPSSAAASGNSQAAQQQKMMMWMMPVMMLVFLYRAPAGLNLYIMASTTAGVVEQLVIRKHIREKEAAERVGLVPATSKTGGKVKKKKPKPPIKFS